MNKVLGALKCSALEIHVSKALFTNGNPGARVTLELAHFFFVVERVYKAGRVTLAQE